MPAQDAPSTTQKRMPPKGRPVEDSDLRLASDASHYYGNMHRRSPFPIIYNVGDMFDGWDTAHRLAGHPDRVIPGHDPVVTEIYPRASDKVDAWSLHLAPSRSFVK